MQHEIDLKQIEFAAKAAQFAATSEFERDGSVTPIDWIRFNCHVTGHSAANSVAVGENLDRLGHCLLGVERGDMGYAHIVVLARTAEVTGDAFDERDLLEKALENSPGKLNALCRHYRHARNPKGIADEEAELYEMRSLKIATGPDGAVSLSGYLDPIGGAAVRSALEPLARKRGADDERDRAQRMADALVEAVSDGDVKASIQVTTTIETLAGLSGSQAAEIQYGLPVSSATVERLGCDCSVTRIILDSESQVIDVGRARRVVSPAQRRALSARDGGCVWPGCERPATWSAAHHLIHWIRGGRTEMDNLVLLCYRHHSLVHEGRWQLVKAEDGRTLPVPPLVRFDHYSRGPD